MIDLTVNDLKGSRSRASWILFLSFFICRNDIDCSYTFVLIYSWDNISEQSSKIGCSIYGTTNMAHIWVKKRQRVEMEAFQPCLYGQYIIYFFSFGSLGNHHPWRLSGPLLKMETELQTDINWNLIKIIFL